MSFNVMNDDDNFWKELKITNRLLSLYYTQQKSMYDSASLYCIIGATQH